ncbi:deoxyribose-phosphate aldolase [Corynebacterium pygosceleis]|uniref:Deoxyribose-phosphate aldolase n=1 Tax=Corynebacterium pygosceleis TaxID=2800406 RepID=A0A9Q4GJL3_9CORY|nr:deoxyribose-phosphate aldolase [Corynebacterium pygosceleis]MCK7637412.1 deoxyribose-phosphate aldolase [Corynebacterium pygosceleis]MCK7676062.1 deoxyribose-phosphate aldolase [Corynebacterium pygosceleis]MCL0119812.1 deoxyribose-phosphate aldolase [Corynebacterium pygosceleis]MCX7468259.1 deoxyribose-phosphate aldolase [Corynebacterium pygosceleis]
MNDSITRDRLAAMIDYTLDTPWASVTEVRHHVATALELGVGQVCVTPSMLHATNAADGFGLRVVSVCGFPSGGHHQLIKAAEARLAVESGADEVDVVLDLAAVRAGDTNRMIGEIVAVREAVPSPVTLKVIIETGLLGETEIRTAARAARTAGANYVRTSTGWFDCPGATPEAVRIIAEETGGGLGIAAAGGITSIDRARELVAAGATRLSVGAEATALLDASGE